MATHLLLPGQSAAPDGPADMTMMYVLHHAFRRDLHDFAAVARGTRATDALRWRAVAERWALFTEQLHAHHTKEDEILWPLLLERVRAAGDTDAERVLQEMEEEHAVLDPLLDAASTALSVLAAGGDLDAFPLFVTTVADLSAALDRHLAHEESAAIEILQRYVGGDEWAQIEKSRFRPKQSLAEARFFVPWALKGLPHAAAQQVLGLGGPPLRVINAMSRRRFIADEARVFGRLVG